MGFALLPLAAIIFFIGMMAVEQTHISHVAPSKTVVKAQWEAQQFVAYRDAVSAYMQSHPTFLGTIPASLLNAPFPEEFLRIVGNSVKTTTSGTGRIITSYAALQPYAIGRVRILTHNDSSIRLDGNGNVVSVIQIGM